MALVVLVGAAGAARPAGATHHSAAMAQAGPGGAQVVLEQIDAFRRGDFTAAYGFASTAIKRQFDPAAFERMVRGDYPEIAAPEETRVLERIMAPDGREYVLLRVLGRNGSAVGGAL